MFKEHGRTVLPGNEGLRPMARTVPAILVVLLAGAIFFYKERMLFIDAPHILFRIINDGRLHIEEFRIGSFITQMFPLFCSKLHLPFKLLVVLYSASFYLFYLSAAALLVYKFRNYALAILYGLYLTLLVSDTFYWPNNEVHQGVAWLMLAFAGSIYFAQRNKLVLILFFAVLFGLAIWTHPLVMFVAIYLWFFMLLSMSLCPFPKWQTIILTIILLTLSFFKFYQGSRHGYDNSKIEVVTHFDLQNIKDVLTSPMLRSFLKSCITDYWIFTLLFISGICTLAWSRKYLLLAFTMLYAAGYLLLVCIVFRDVSPNRFYIESEYMPLTFICCAPFVYFLLPRLNTRIGLSIILLIFAVRIGYIYAASGTFTSRVTAIAAVNEKMKAKGLSKVIVPEPVPEISSTLITNWGAPVESIIFSKLRGEVPQRTFIFIDPGQLPAVSNMGKDTLLGCWQKWPTSDINTFYFQPDTGAAYVVMNYADLMK